jgi:hypothetical protein
MCRECSYISLIMSLSVLNIMVTKLIISLNFRMWIFCFAGRNLSGFDESSYVRFEVRWAVLMKSSVFWGCMCVHTCVRNVCIYKGWAVKPALALWPLLIYVMLYSLMKVNSITKPGRNQHVAACFWLHGFLFIHSFIYWSTIDPLNIQHGCGYHHKIITHLQ